MSKFSYVITSQYNSTYLTHSMMDKIKFSVDEIVATRATGIQYTYVHLKKKANDDVLARALKTLESDGVIGSGIYGYNTVDGNTPSVSEHLEDHPGFQTLVEHDTLRNCEFRRWTAEGHGSDRLRGYNLLKNRLLAKRVSKQAAGGGGSAPGRETSDDEEEEEQAPRPDANRTNEERSKRRRTGSPDQSKEYFGVAMDKMAATLSAVVASAINSSGSVGNKEREYEQKRRERAESQVRELEMKQKLSEQRRLVKGEVAAKYQAVVEETSVKLRCAEDELEKQRLHVLNEIAKTAAVEHQVIGLSGIAEEALVMVREVCESNKLLVGRLAAREEEDIAIKKAFEEKETLHAAVIAGKNNELKSFGETYAIDLKSKEEAARANEAILITQLEKTKRTSRELIASKDRDAIDESKKHKTELENQAIALQTKSDEKFEAQAAYLENEFQGKMSLKIEEFNILEEEYSRDLAVSHDGLLNLRQELVVGNDEIKRLTKCMDDSKVTINDQDKEIRRISQTIIDSATLSKREMDICLEKKDLEIASLKRRLQTTNAPFAAKIVELETLQVVVVVFSCVFQSSNHIFQVNKSNEIGKMSRELDQLKLRYHVLERDTDKISARVEGLEDDVAKLNEQLDVRNEELKAEQTKSADVSHQLDMFTEGYDRWMVKALNLSRQNDQLNRAADERRERLMWFEAMLHGGNTHSDSGTMGSVNVQASNDTPEISDPPPPPVPRSASASPVVKVVRRKSSSNSVDMKEREFMFIFTGQGIEVGVYEFDWRMQRIEYGMIDATYKYCVMKLHRNFGCRRVNLINVVNEYNKKAGPDFQVTLRLENLGGKQVSRFYLRKDRGVNPITERLVDDRKKRPSGYRVWSNRVNKPPKGTVIVDEEEDTPAAPLANADQTASVEEAVCGLESLDTEDDNEDEQAQGSSTM